jgi:hypothetical protein
MIALFLLAFGVASTVLALWFDVRFESRRPAELRFALLHIAAAWCVAQFLVGPGMSALANSGHVVAGVMFVALPATVYCLISVVWLMRVCAGALSRGGLRN